MTVKQYSTNSTVQYKTDDSKKKKVIYTSSVSIPTTLSIL